MARRAHTQACRFGAEFLVQRATGLRVDGQYRFIQMMDGREVSTHAVLLSPGVQYRKLQIPGAERLTGRGIYYGAALVEAVACKDEAVYVVGGANSAGQAALHFAHYARSVTMLVRGEGLSASMAKYLIDEIGRTSNIDVETRTEVVEARGEERLEALRLRTPEGERRFRLRRCSFSSGPRREPIGCRAAFCATRRDLCWPGRICVPTRSCPRDGRKSGSRFCWRAAYRAFCGGDVRHGSVKRVASAVGEGSIAVQFVHQYLAGF